MLKASHIAYLVDVETGGLISAEEQANMGPINL
jgi:hypothetical protein